MSSYKKISENTVLNQRQLVIDKINELIKENKVAKKDLAEIIGCHQSELSRWLNGKNSFSIDVFIKLSLALQFSIICPKASTTSKYVEEKEHIFSSVGKFRRTLDLV